MKVALASALALPALVSAHGLRDVHHARQQPNPAPQSGTTTATVVIPSGPAGTPAPPPATTPTLTFTLASTNPTALPLSEIASGAPSEATVPASTTYAGGTKPTFLPNAPALPDINSLVVSKYPPLDKIPPTDSPEVQKWKQEVADSGVTIPDIKPTVPGGCPTNLDAVADTSRCWSTCSTCTADDVVTCPDKLTWGLTYDDGPALHTGSLLQYLDQQNLKATFFVVGSRAISYPALLQQEYMAQHQIAIHTWSHPPMTTLTNDEIIAELGWSRQIMQDVLGVTPKYWRSPYGDVDNRVRAIAKALGLKTSLWTRISAEATFDTGDFDIAAGTITSTGVLNNWRNIIGNATAIDTGFIVLEHDLFQQTVDIAIDYILPDALAHQPPFKIEPIISCLKEPLGNAYAETTDNSTTSSSGSGNGAQGSSGSNSTSADANNGSMAAIVAPHSLAAIALAVVTGAIAFFV